MAHFQQPAERGSVAYPAGRKACDAMPWDTAASSALHTRNRLWACAPRKPLQSSLVTWGGSSSCCAVSPACCAAVQIASDGLKGRVVEVSLADLQNVSQCLYPLSLSVPL